MDRYKLRWFLFIGLIFVLAACAGAKEVPYTTATPHPTMVKVAEPETSADSDPMADDCKPDESGTDDAAEGNSNDASGEKTPAGLFASNCASCHGADRSGARGPSLLPDRLTKEASQYAETITNGSGPMPSFRSRLSTEEINALAEWILTPVE